MVNFFVQMKFGKFVGVNQNNLVIPGSLLKNQEKSWKSPGMLSIRKIGIPD